MSAGGKQTGTRWHAFQSSARMEKGKDLGAQCSGTRSTACQPNQVDAALELGRPASEPDVITVIEIVPARDRFQRPVTIRHRKMIKDLGKFLGLDVIRIYDKPRGEEGGGKY